MLEKTEAMKKHKTWKLVDLPEVRKAIGCRCVFKKQTIADKADEKFKHKLIAQVFNHKHGVNYDGENKNQLPEQYCKCKWLVKEEIGEPEPPPSFWKFKKESI